ncbi:hypothetical protein scyTo_0020290 [Scyliorhinus torazame]|uniref:Uncharacterized protein n=1 Tax=Scyliorhinus torazame TaxID=75743 RepID=A0A401PP50_SCYTO|nr:hypothetical protein [Scyliorhinus torazame]
MAISHSPPAVGPRLLWEPWSSGRCAPWRAGGHGVGGAHARLGRGPREQSIPGCPAKRAKAAQQLPFDDDSQDFEPEKPPSKSKVRGRRTARPAVCPILGDNSARGQKPSKARGREGCSPVKEEGGKQMKRSAAPTGSLIDQLKEQKGNRSQEDDCAEDSEDEWEEVEAQFEDYLRRMINRFTRNLRVDIHKVHLVCLLANGMFRNRMCNEPELWAMALSLIPTNLAMVPGGRVEIPYISKLLKWFVSTFDIDPSLPSDEMDSLLTVLKRRFGSHSARNGQEMVHVCIRCVTVY